MAGVIREMVESDWDGLMRLRERSPAGTELVLRNEPVRGARRVAYGELVTLVCEMDGEIVGAMSCWIHTTRIHGTDLKCALIYAVRVDPEYRRKGVPTKLWLAVQRLARSKGAVVLKALVAPDGVSKQILAGLGFTHVADCVIWGIPVIWRRATRSPAVVRELERADLPGLVDLINHFYSDHDFFLPWDANQSESDLAFIHGFEREALLVAERHGQLTACLGVADYTNAVRTVVVKLTPRLRLLKSLGDLGSKIGCAPRVPGPGEELRHLVVFPLAYSSAADMCALFNRVNKKAREDGVPLITVIAGADEALPFLPHLLKIGIRENVMLRSLTGNSILPVGKVHMVPAEL